MKKNCHLTNVIQEIASYTGAVKLQIPHAVTDCMNLFQNVLKTSFFTSIAI